jgi:cytochrome P450
MSDAEVEREAAAPVSEIPGPGGPEMLANIRLMRRHPPQFLAQCAQRYGAVVRFPIPRSEVLLVTDPADMRRVLQGNHTGYGKRTIQYDTLALVTGHGLLASDGDLWKRMRRLMSPAFHRGLVGDMAGAIVDVTDRWTRMARARGGSSFDLDAAMLELSLHVVAATLFGGRIERAPALVEAVMAALHVVVAKAQQPLPVPRSWPTPGNRRLTRSLAVLDAAVDDVITQRRRQPAGTDVLWTLIAALDEGVASRREVRDEIVTLIVAGHETVAATLTWTWTLLARHRDAEQRLHLEVDALDDDALASPTAMDRLPFTRAVIDECLRLYPPAWVITRRSLQPDVLGGCRVPTNATVILSPFVTQRDPRHWPRPESFEPERFLGAPGSDVGSGPLTYLPFGAGPRLCIGRDLALLEAPLVVASIARHLRFAVPRSAGARLDFGVTLRPQGGLPAIALSRR